MSGRQDRQLATPDLSLVRGTACSGKARRRGDAASAPRELKAEAPRCGEARGEQEAMMAQKVCLVRRPMPHAEDRQSREKLFCCY